MIVALRGEIEGGFFALDLFLLGVSALARLRTVRGSGVAHEPAGVVVGGGRESTLGVVDEQGLVVCGAGGVAHGDAPQAVRVAPRVPINAVRIDAAAEQAFGDDRAQGALGDMLTGFAHVGVGG